MSETALITVSAKEGFLRSLIAGGAVEKLIPEDASSEDVLLRLRACVGADVDIRKIGALLALAVGRCLALAAERPEIWRDAGYERFTDFVDAEAEARGVSHGTAWGGIKAGRVFKGMPIEDYVKDGGLTNLRTAAYGLPPDASPHQKQEALERLPLPTAEYSKWFEGKYSMPAGATQYSRITLEGNYAQVQEMTDYVDDAASTEWAGTRHPLDKVLWAIRNAYTEIPPKKGNEIPEGHPAADLGWEDTLG